MAMTGAGQAASVGLMLGSLGVLAYAVLGGLVWNFALRPREEADLERCFGEHLAGKANRRLLIWSLLAVDQWCRSFQ